MYRRFRFSLIGALAGLALFAGAAQADDTLSPSFGPDPTEEVPVPITATWSATTNSTRVYVTVSWPADWAARRTQPRPSIPTATMSSITPAGRAPAVTA